MSGYELQAAPVEEEAIAVPLPVSLPMLSASDDERAVAGIRRAKGFGGLAGFGIAAVAAYMSGELMSSLLLRALIGGVAGYMVAWLGAVTVWRRIIRAELQHRFAALERARAARATELETT